MILGDHAVFLMTAIINNHECNKPAVNQLESTSISQLIIASDFYMMTNDMNSDTALDFGLIRC